MGNIKPLLKSLATIFAHSDNTVRAGGVALAMTLYTFLGAALLPSLAEIKPVQMSDLQKSFDSLDANGNGSGTGRATRWTRKAQRARDAADAAGESSSIGGTAVEEAPVTIDPKYLLVPVNALSKFPADLDERLSSAKWKDRLEVLEECNNILGQPQNARISEANVDAYASFVSALGTKCKSDANVNVVIEAARVIEGLANGLGRSFGRYRNLTMSGCLDRLKERKTNVVEALGNTLDAIFSTVSYDQVQVLCADLSL